MTLSLAEKNYITESLREAQQLYKERKYIDAAEILQEIVNRYPGCLLKLYSTLTDCYKKGEDIYDAMEVYKLVIEQYPEEKLYAYGGLATICLENNDFERAKIHFEQMLKLDVTLQQKDEINKQIAICNEGVASQQKESKKPSDMQEVQSKFTALQISQSTEMPVQTSVERQSRSSDHAASPRCGETTLKQSVTPSVPAR